MQNVKFWAEIFGPFFLNGGNVKIPIRLHVKFQKIVFQAQSKHPQIFMQ